MRGDESRLIWWSGLAALLGGTLWVPLRSLIAFTWDRPRYGLTYEQWNSLMPAVLLLLLAGIAGVYGRHAHWVGRLGRAGLAIVAAGLLLEIAGVVVEFWWAGGLRYNRTGSAIGWSIFLLGYFAVGFGITAFGAGTLRAAVLPRWCRAVPALLGLLTLSWPFTLAYGNDAVDVAREALVGLGWAALGLALWLEPRLPQDPARHSARAAARTR